jgi:cytochrome c peroxidase
MKAFWTLRLVLAPIIAAALAFLPGRAGAAELSLAPLPAEPMPKAEVVELGKFLFFDERLSGDGSISCAKCHNPKKAWGDGTPLSEGYPGTAYFRNAPSLYNTAHFGRAGLAYTWDGRLSGKDPDTLVRDMITDVHFHQMDSRLLWERWKQVPEYVEMFKKAYGKEPNHSRTYNAIASFVATIVSKNVALDRYLRGDQGALSSQAARGFELFKGKAGCIQCHHGPLLSDGKYHALGVPENPDIVNTPLRHLTMRRQFGYIGVPNYETVKVDLGRYTITKDPADRGRFKTAPLREVARTAPYMHNGMLKSLEEVIDFYDRGGGAAANKPPLLKPLNLSAEEKTALVEFLKSLSGDEVVVEGPKPPPYRPVTLGKN